MSALIEWFSSLQPNVQAAVIGAAVGVLTIIAKDFGLTVWNARRQRHQSQQDTYQRYADPLLSAAASLFWRLDEVRNPDGRGRFLLASAPDNYFTKYKRRSTYFRLATLIAWIRAFRRELSYLRAVDRRDSDAVHAAIGAFESALADGHDVEVQRVKALAEKLGLVPPVEQDRIAKAAVALEHAIDDYLRHIGLGPDAIKPNLPLWLTDDQKLELCQRMATAIAATWGVSPLPDAHVAAHKDLCCTAVAIREAWLFRDWQAAVGDIMLVPAAGAGRRFDVIGFGEFETMCSKASPTQYEYLSRLEALFDDLDVRAVPAFDARISQLNATHAACCALIVALSSIRGTRDALPLATAVRAHRVAGRRLPLMLWLRHSLATHAQAKKAAK